MAASLSSCFTGVESTPKIGAADLRKQNVADSPEQHYLADFGQQRLNDWRPGKQLLVTDNKIALFLGPEAEKGEPLEGSILTFQGVKDAISLSGDSVARLRFTTATGTNVAYDMDASASSVAKRASVEIPLTIELSIVEAVKNKMVGNTYYILTRDWYDTSNQPSRGRRFVPVKVTDVLPGSSFYPVLLVMQDEKGNPFHLYMSVGHDVKAPRNFALLFSLTDPRQKYPQISDEAWAHIVNGTVAQDMTRDECRMSLGAPDNIDRRPGYSILSEIWSYENGKYLIFEDGLLRSFRL